MNEFANVGLSEPHHRLRYQTTLNTLKYYMPLSEQHVLNLGEGREFGQVLTPLVASYQDYEQELRAPFNFDDAVFDLVLCMETIEHIKDVDTAPRETFDFSGINIMLKEAYRVVKPGGNIFLSTPNVCAWSSFIRLADLQHPFMYSLHNRELAPSDVRSALRHAGFSVPLLWTCDVWNQHGKNRDRLAQAAKFVATVRGNDDLRGDIIFAIGYK